MDMFTDATEQEVAEASSLHQTTPRCSFKRLKILHVGFENNGVDV